MKVEIIIQPNILQDILYILKATGSLHHTIAQSMSINVSGAFPHTDKIKLLTTCTTKQKEKNMTSVTPFIEGRKGIYSLSYY
ncbi:MAG: hypothetical protein JWO58_2520 [Chitinophagaceae bacterium]|nr:hypothetical protein [Chitinophagaceae bacterium]